MIVMTDRVSRYFKTRRGSCFPFRQIGKEGSFCIVLDQCVTDAELVNLRFAQNCKVFIPDLDDKNDVRSDDCLWVLDAGPQRGAQESEAERHGNDILDLANIFEMETFRIIGHGPVADWLLEHHAHRIEGIFEAVVASPSPRSEADEAALALSR